MKFPMVYTHLGYDYLEKVNYKIIHSGVDFNKGRPNDDLGEPVLSISNGKVVYCKDTGKGWGKMIVVYYAAYGVWARYAHLDSFHVSHGDNVEEGQQIGTCGASGGSWAPHLHFDIILKELPEWTKYTSWWSKDKVMQYYADPIKWIKNIQASEDKEPAIVKWHKKHKIIEHWNKPPTPEEIKAAWIAYKTAKAILKLKENDFNL